MKIKQTPEDFRVDEITDVVPGDGPFAFYTLEKTNWTTSDAAHTIRRRWHIRTHDLSYGGLKDRHAHTTQHLTIRGGPKRDLTHDGFSLKYLGQLPHPFEPACIRGNRFRLIVRDLSAENVAAAREALAEVAHDGLGNYFDDQRFGSVTLGKDFVARRLVQEDWEGALKLALTAPYDFDRGSVKKEKAALAQFWGDWAGCQQKLPRGQSRDVVGHLAARPTDFRGAFGRMKSDLASLYLAAYQSHLWNRLLAAWLQRNLPAHQVVYIQLKLDEVPTPRHLSGGKRDELARLTLPLPSARLHFDAALPTAAPDWAEVLRDVLETEGIKLEQLKLKGVRRPFFSRGERNVLDVPTELSADSGRDEKEPGRFKMQLRFVLPRGSYATLLVKRLFQGS